MTKHSLQEKVSVRDRVLNLHQGKGEHEGRVICDQKIEGGIQSVHRAQFLDELVKGVPSERAHFNKRLLSIEDSDGSGSVLHFADGTTAKADAVIGADGIHSIVRKHILGESDIASRTTFSGCACYRGLVPIDKAVEKVGEEYAHNSMLICGPGIVLVINFERSNSNIDCVAGKAIFSYPIDHGRQFNIVVADLDHPDWESDQWVLPATYSQLVGHFDGWSTTCHNLVELFDIPNLTKWALRDNLPAATYTLGNVAIMGDAAHASTPFQGQGAGQAIEDALVLEILLGRVQDAKHIPNALAAYDQVRKARSQRVVTTSRESGILFAMKAKGVGEDFEKIKEKTETRMNWIWKRDLEKQNAEAIALYEESL